MLVNVSAGGTQGVPDLRLSATLLLSYRNTLSEMYSDIPSVNTYPWTVLDAFGIGPGDVAYVGRSAAAVWGDILARLNDRSAVLRFVEDLREGDTSKSAWSARLDELRRLAETSRPTGVAEQPIQDGPLDWTTPQPLRRACVALEELRVFRTKLLEHLRHAATMWRGGDSLPHLPLLVVRHRLDGLTGTLDLVDHPEVARAAAEAGDIDEFRDAVSDLRALLDHARTQLVAEEIDELLVTVREMERAANALGQYVRRAVRHSALRELHDLLVELQQRLMQWDKVWEGLRALGNPESWDEIKWMMASSVAGWGQTIGPASFGLPALAARRAELSVVMRNLDRAVDRFFDDEQDRRDTIVESARRVVLRFADMIRIVQEQLIGFS